MGTRSLTRFHNENKEDICVLYRQFDGYPEGHGKELAAFLEGFTIVDGYNPAMKGKVANGAACLAAQVITHFKKGVGNFYLYPAGSDDLDEEYIYDVECSVANGITLRCYEVPYPPTEDLIEKFVGPPEEYKDWITMLEEN